MSPAGPLKTPQLGSIVHRHGSALSRPLRWRAIAKAKGIALADVNHALDLFAEATFNDKVREHRLARQTGCVAGSALRSRFWKATCRARDWSRRSSSAAT